MSIVSEVGEKYCNLPEILDKYNDDIKDVKAEINLKGKTLMDANSENTSYLHYYDQRKVELHTLVKYFKMEENRIKSELFVGYKEEYSRALSDREITKYIDGEDSFLAVHSLLIEVEELYETYVSIVDAFTSRKFILTNITKLRVAELENVEI